MRRIAMCVAIIGFPTFARSGYAANLATEAGDQKKAVAEIEKLGGRIEVDVKAQGWPVVGVDFSWPPAVTQTGLQPLRVLTQLWSSSPQDTPVRDAGLEHLKGLTHLRELDLGGTQVTDAGLERLKGLTQLRKLDLNNTKVTDAGLKHLKGMTQLQKLALRQTRVTDAGLEHVTDLTRLQKLDLGNTQVTDAGLEHLKGLRQLRHLDLGGTKLTGAGLESLKGLANLQTLDLMSTKLTDAGLDNLKGLTLLRWLNLYGTQVTDAGVKRLQQALPECGIQPARSPTFTREAPQAEFRTWTDVTGKYKREARFVDFKDGKVRLKKKDGTEVSMPLDKLSAEDQAVVKARAAHANATEQAPGGSTQSRQ